MAIIQLTKIIMRSGLAIDLPGKPTSLAPLRYEAGLEVGEMGFASDIGRVFVGSDPAQGSPQFNRTVFPYRNIEVLTENSTDTINRMVGDAMREGGSDMYYHSNLPAHTTDWEDVLLPRQGDETYNFRLAYSDYVSATIEYAVYDEDLHPLKLGELQLQYMTGEAEPSMIDDAMVMRRLDMMEPEAFQAGAAYNQVSFRFKVAGPVGAKYLSFQYNNLTNSVLSLRFRVNRPKV